MRSVLFLAANSKEGQKIGSKVIADALSVPRPFLAKILQQLSRHQIVSSSKGAGGGFFLSSENLQRTLHDVIECIDGKGIYDNCILGLPICSSDYPCPLHFQAKKYRDGLKEIIDQQSIGDLAKQIIAKNMSI